MEREGEERAIEVGGDGGGVDEDCRRMEGGKRRASGVSDATSAYDDADERSIRSIK